MDVNGGRQLVDVIVVSSLVEETGEVLWKRETDDRDRGVSVAGRPVGHDEWEWALVVPIAEFVRTEDFRNQIEAAVRSADGVREIMDEDREVWRVRGLVSGEDLVRRVAPVIDQIIDEGTH